MSDRDDAAVPGRVRIGISGWHYPEWRGGFYPETLRQPEELPFASARFPTIEINSTFYGLQSHERYARWAERTPPDFVFSVKGPREVLRRVKGPDVRSALADFFASGLLRLGGKLGPILWQFPQSVAFDAAIFDAFLAALPRDTVAAAELARHHDAVRLAGRAWLDAGEPRPLRHAVEVRHPSFATSAFVEILRRHGVALVCADSPQWPRLMEVTAPFAYCRLHGSERLYVSGYDDAALARWAERVADWAWGREPGDVERIGGAEVDSTAPVVPRDVYVYFDNTMRGRAPFDAARLHELTGPLLDIRPS